MINEKWKETPYVNTDKVKALVNLGRKPCFSMIWRFVLRKMKEQVLSAFLTIVATLRRSVCLTLFIRCFERNKNGRI